MSDRMDVIIAGSGLVGATLALTLARLGLRVAVIDPVPEAAHRDDGFDGRAYAVALGSERLLGCLGVWQRVHEKGQEIARIEVSDAVRPGRTAPALLHFDPAETGQGRVGTILEDRYLRRGLLDAIDEVDGIRHLPEARVEHADFGAFGAEVTLADGKQFRASLVVAADGRSSEIASMAGIRRIGWRYGQTGHVCAIGHERPHGGVAHQTFFAGGPFAVLPLTGNRSSLVWSEKEADSRRIAAFDDQAYAAEVAARMAGRLGAIELLGPRWAYPLSLSLAERYAAPRIALVGDAAHGVHPIAGQGMNMGLRDVAALAEVLAEAMRIGEDIGGIEVLRRYERWRRFDATAMSLGMDALNRLFSTDLGPLSLFRDAGARLLGGFGAARRRLMAEATGQSGDLPRLLAGEWP